MILQTSWILLLLPCTSAIIGFDCGRRPNNITTISLRDVGPCDIDFGKPEVKIVEMQLLQKIEYESVHVHGCKIRVDREINVCGMFSHLLNVKKGKETFYVTVSRDACQDIIRFSSYEYEKIKISDIKMNATTRATITLAGIQKDGGGCEGAVYTTKNGEYSNVVVTAQLEIYVFDYMANANRDKDELILQSGVRCNYKDARCTDMDGGNIYWEYIPTSRCNYNQYVLLFDGKAVKVGNDTTENPNVYFSNSTDIVQFGLMKTGTIVMCGYQIYSTDHPKLFITEYPRGKGMVVEKSLNVHDILVTAYFNTKLAYLARHFETQISNMYNDMLLQRCRLHRQVIQNSLMHMHTKPDVAALIIMRKHGYTAVPVGEVAHLVLCEETVCKVRQTNECYQEIPVSCKNETYFLKPFTRIMVKTGTLRHCNNILPAMYFLEDVWLKFSPKPEEGRIPQTLNPQTAPTWHYQDIRGLIEGGIYTAEDLERLHKHTMFPSEKNSYTEEVARRLSGESNYGSHVDFGNLIDRVTIESYIRKTINKIWNGFTEFGVFFAGLMGVIFILNSIKYVASTIVHAYTLHSIYGWSLHLLAALWGSLTHFFVVLAHKYDIENNSKKFEDIEGQKQASNTPTDNKCLTNPQERPTFYQIEMENVNTITRIPTVEHKPTAPMEEPTATMDDSTVVEINNDQCPNSPRTMELERKLLEYIRKNNKK